MTAVRRTPYAFFYAEDDQRLQLASLLQGALPEPARKARVLALALLTGQRHRVTREELELLLSVPAEQWVDDAALDRGLVGDLLGKALLLSDVDERPLRDLRERDEAISANEWNLFAALYHYMTQWSGAEMARDDNGNPLLGEHARAAAATFVADHGPPPPAFADPRADQAVALPGVDREGGLYRALTARRTTRAFDPQQPMTLEQLDTVLRYVFGCHGYATMFTDHLCIKRTSPSGGALHPIEVYPIIGNVEGVPPGIYQYAGRDHSLRSMSRLDAGEVRRMVSSFMCSQDYLGAASVAFVLTARFYRSHWKYRRHQKAYATILMEAGHLSQTLYLVSAELGLGAFVTSAINSRDIEGRLGLDGVSEGVIAMAGCGQRSPDGSPWELEASPDPPF